MKLSGNTIFITGATAGIGRGLAEEFHRLGNQVIISGRRTALLDEVTAANPGMQSVALDMTSKDSIDAAARWLKDNHPALNVLINNAGIMPFDDPAGDIDDEVMVATIATNLFGPIRMTAALMETLKAQPEAAIIHNTSVVAFQPLATNAVYSATKAALHSYTQTQRFALRNTAVKVIEIAPPWVNTDLIHKSDDPRAMPLDVYIKDTMTQLATDSTGIYVERVREMLNVPRSEEYERIASRNQALVDNPIPRG
ncbi:SDR family oxidoreductase [Luteibacter yeojuensis]|jgi:uncharacterized oxidoreductase